MEFENIELSTIGKQFEYEKRSREFDNIKDPDELRSIVKAIFKLYLKQQETLVKITLDNLNSDGL